MQSIVRSNVSSTQFDALADCGSSILHLIEYVFVDGELEAEIVSVPLKESNSEKGDVLVDQRTQTLEVFKMQYEYLSGHFVLLTVVEIVADGDTEREGSPVKQCQSVRLTPALVSTFLAQGFEIVTVF